MEVAFVYKAKFVSLKLNTSILSQGVKESPARDSPAILWLELFNLKANKHP